MKVARLAACTALGLAACAQVPQADAVKAEDNIPEGSATLPAGGKAIATFESLGLYWTPPANPGAAGCLARYRSASDKAWKDGLAMWYDARNGECRGSLVHLAPGTSY